MSVDLINQITDLVKSGKFDYILIEASGICEPLPIAQSISVLEGDKENNIPELVRLDNIVTVVDALRMATEFGCGDDLLKEDVDEEDVESLLIQQIEFCSTIILNKVDKVTEEQLKRVKAMIKTLQPKARIIESQFGKVEVKDILDTKCFNFEETAASAGWAQIYDKDEDDEDTDRHGHHHHHHHHDGDHDEHEHHDHDHDEDGHECCHHHHDHDDDDDDEDEEHEHHHHHDHDDDDHDGHCCCGHHHDHDEDDDEDEHEHHHHDHDDHDGHCCCGHHHHHHDHDADEVFTSWGVETAKKFSKADIEHALTELDTGNYGMILRSKGIVDGGADGWLEFDYVPGEWEVRARGADVGGKLVVIGSKLDEKAIAALFGC